MILNILLEAHSKFGLKSVQLLEKLIAKKMNKANLYLQISASLGNSER